MSSNGITRTTIEETQEICTLCGGRGQLTTINPNFTAACSMTSCRNCGGSGHIVTKRVVRTEDIDIDAIADRVSRRLMDGLRFGRIAVTKFGNSRIDIRGE